MEPTTTTSRFLLVVNNIPPYGPELVNVLAAPPLSTCRFRYQRKYAPTIGNITSLIDKEGTIVLRSHGTGRFMPLRTCKVILVRLVGDIVYLTAELHDIAAIASDKLSEEQLRVFNELMVNAIGTFENPQGGDLLNLILYEDGAVYQRLHQWLEASDGDECGHWGNCILLMAHEFDLQAVDYYKIVELRDAQNRVLTFEPAKRVDGGYALQTESTYTLVVLQRTYTGKKGDSSVSGNRFLELTTNSENVTILRGKQPILGKYDVFHLYIRPTPSSRRNYLQLFLGASADKGTDVFRVSPLEIPLSIEASLRLKLRTIASGSVFVFLLLAYLFSHAVSGFFPAQWSVTAAEVEKVCLIGMILVGMQLGELPRQLIARFKLGVH